MYTIIQNVLLKNLLQGKDHLWHPVTQFPAEHGYVWSKCPSPLETSGWPQLSTPSKARQCLVQISGKDLVVQNPQQAWS